MILNQKQTYLNNYDSQNFSAVLPQNIPELSVQSSIKGRNRAALTWTATKNPEILLQTRIGIH